MAYEIALPQQEEARGFEDYLDALKRRRTPALLIAASIFVLGVVVIFLLPTSYRSSATILIEEPKVPPGLVASTVTTFASRQVQYINQRVMTRTKLAEIIEKYNLYPQERKYLPTLMLVKDVEKNVKIDVIDVQTAGRESAQPITTTIAFQLSFEHESPKTAREVTNELVTMYLGENVRVRTEQTAQTSQFINDEVSRLEKEMAALGEMIADYKRANADSLPEYNVVNQQIMQRLEDELLDISRQLNANQGTQTLLTAQLATIPPIGNRLLPDGKPALSPMDQLKNLQNQLAVLEGRYGPDHPDVIRAKSDIAGIKAQIGADTDLTDSDTDTGVALRQAKTDLAKAREKYSADHPETQRLEKLVMTLQKPLDSPKPKIAGPGKAQPDNPAYIQIQAQLNMLRADNAAYVKKQQEIRDRIATMEKNMAQSSDVERGLFDLTRKLQTASQAYQIAREKLNSAKLGESLEAEAKGERFLLVEPPDLPLLPSSPNRPLLLAVVVFLTVLAGFGWPQLAEALDHTINGSRAVERIQGAPPIAEIPLIATEGDRRSVTRWNLIGWISVGALLLTGALLIHFLWLPLDVAWYVGLRRLGL